MPVRILDAWSAVTPAAGLMLPTTGAWSSTVGLALPSGGQPQINLLPAEVREHRAQQTTQRTWLVTAGCFLAVLGALAGLMQVDLRAHRRMNAELASALRDVTPRAQGLAHQTQRVQQAATLLAQRGTLLTLLEELYQATPETVRLTQFLAEPEGEVRVRGHAPSLKEILDYVTALEETPHLRDMQLRYSTERATRTGQQVEFEIIGRVDRAVRTAQIAPASPPAAASKKESR